MNELLQVKQQCVEVAVPVPVKGVFTYRIPQSITQDVLPGTRVLVPFRNRDIVGYVVDLTEPSPEMKLKDVKEVLDDKPVLTESILKLTKKIADYYGSSWGESIENALPKWVKYGKKAERALAKEKIEESAIVDEGQQKQFNLSEEQSRSLKAIHQAFDNHHRKPILLFGVTGSGKSEVYIRAIHETIKRNKSAICLVPEIALTEQIRRFFSSHFGSELEILHSKLTDRERFLAWKRCESGRKQVILGPRSAVFAPVPNLGLLIIDEEHEGTYKQETVPRYHAREVACWRAENENAVLVMGSATPSLESMHKAQQGSYECIQLQSRVDQKPLPSVQVVDLKESYQSKARNSIFSLQLSKAIEENLQSKQGTMLLLNRRGFSTNINCKRCGQVESCTSCQVSMTFHQEDGILLCHYCNLRKAVPKACTNCGNELLRYTGFGTEKVESEIGRCFPTAKVARMDADTIRKRGTHEEILKDFRDQKYDILIGTQMIAKGFDFPHVTLVGVINADVGLMLPDFRSSERTFQLITQVAGRAGRGSKPGRVIVQTFSPEHPSISFAKKHDYQSFYQYECSERLQYHYPPTGHLINIIVRGKDEKKPYLFAREIKQKLTDSINPHETKVEVLGPAPLPFYRLRGHYRWHIMVKGSKVAEMTSEIIDSVQSIRKPSAVNFAIDVDPLTIL